MSTIALYANKTNQMPNLIKDIRQAVTDYKSELLKLKTKTLSINKSVCNLDNVISSIQSSSQTQEQKISSLNTLNKNLETFTSKVIHVDSDVADEVKKRKDNFYDKYNYLKPECEKGTWEKIKDGCKKVGAWCKEQLKKIITTLVIVIGTIIAIAIIIGAIIAIAVAISTIGSALVTVLTGLGISLGIATAISMVVSGIVLITAYACLGGYIFDIAGKIFKSDKLKTIGFALHHPIKAIKIGEVKSGEGNTNISTNASRFSWAFDFKDNEVGEGSEVNAFRHAIWMATITNKWGENTALRVGNSHEKNHQALNGINDVYTHKFDSMSEADEAVDLLNNIIGREIGKSSKPNGTMKDIAKDVLNYYHTQGLNVVQETDGGFVIVKEKLSKERYEEAIRTLETLDDNGFPPDDKYYNKK